MSRSATRRGAAAALAAAACVAVGDLAAAQQEPPPAGVVDLVLPVEDLSLATASLDDSISTRRSARRTRVTLAADVLFRFNRATLTPKAQSRLAEAAAAVRERSPDVVEVVGHTDSKGSDAYNLALSRRRAEAVARALRSELGPDAPRLRTEGRGEAEPVAPNADKDGSDNPRGRARNRRVTVSFGR